MVRVVKQLESSQVAIGWVVPPPPGVGVFSQGSWWPLAQNSAAAKCA